MIKKVLALVTGATVVAALVYLNEQFRGTPALHWQVVAEPPLEVEVLRPRRRTIIHTITAPGKVEPVIEVDVSSQVVGRIVRLPVRDGDWVKTGDLLAKLDSAEYEAQVRSAQARVARLEAGIRRAHADLEKAQRDAARARRLATQEAASEDEVADAQTVLESTTAAHQMALQELVEARAALEMAQDNLGDTVITSPIDGLVSLLLVEEGEVVIPGTMNNPGTVMMVVSDTKRMQVRARIDEADVPLVKPGQRAWIYLTAEAQTALEGVVQRVTPKGVQQGEAATFETRILIREPTEIIRSGMTANVVIEVREHPDALTVPVQAVRHRKRSDLPESWQKQAPESEADGRPVTSTAPVRQPDLAPHQAQAAEYLKVIFIAKEGSAHLRVVDTDISDETHVEIVGGLTDEDQVIVGPYRVLDILTEGRSVTASLSGHNQKQP